MEKVILHSDLNSFYASVEMMLNPDLKGKAVAVGGSTGERHGIVLAKSELAKKAGVQTGMPNWLARQKCPEIIIVPPQYGEYEKYSKLARGIYEDYTDLVEPYGLDECWLDVTGSQMLFGSPMDIAKDIGRRTKEELGLSVSIGIAENKVFAKLGSDMKKPDGITFLPTDAMEKKIWPLAVSDMIFCGRSTTKKLAIHGIRTIGDLANTPVELVRYALGKNGVMLWQYAKGLDRSPVMHKDMVSPVKSLGHGITCVRDLCNEREVQLVFLDLADRLSRRLQRQGLVAGGVQIAVKDRHLQERQSQMHLELASQSGSALAKAAMILFRRHYAWDDMVRALSVRAIHLKSEESPQQMSLYVDYEKEEKRQCIERTMEEIRLRYGRGAVQWAALLEEHKMPHMATRPKMVFKGENLD